MAYEQILKRSEKSKELSSPYQSQQLCAFLGLTGFYHCFVNDYAHIATLLYALP